MKKGEKLNANQTDILKKFMLDFLPKRGNKRKGQKNEIEYISSTIGRIFSKYFNYTVSTREIMNAFEELGYDVFLKNSAWDAQKKEFKPTKSGNTIRFDGIYADYKAAFIYIDIEPSLVGQLRLVTSGLPPKTKPEKIMQTEDLKKKIDLFKKTVKLI